MSHLRVLCLHGYHGSGAILRDQMASLVAALPSDIEFVYVDAPSLATGDFGWWHEGFDGWERTRDWAIGLVCAGPRFDGVFGFSQGAALAGLLTAVQESGEAPPPFHFGFAIMVGGFTSDLPHPSPASSLTGKELTVNRDAHAESGASPVTDRVPAPVGAATMSLLVTATSQFSALGTPTRSAPGIVSLL